MSDKLRISGQKKSAGGIAAIFHSADHLIREVGLIDGVKLMAKINQTNGFDCPGCAWPDPDHDRSVVEFCENGAKAVAEEATTAKCDEQFFKRHTVSSMLDWTDFEIGKSGRLVEPMILNEDSDHYVPITWDGAFSKIGSTLKKQKSPNDAVFYTSGRTSNEAAFLYQLFVRMYGTNNLPDCSNMCHESSGVALTETVGIGKGTVKLDDFHHAEVIVIVGQNPGTNHPRMLTALQEAKKNGAKIITINPIEEAGLISFRHPQHPLDLIGKSTPITDLWLQVRINEDVALLKAMIRMLYDREKMTPGKVFNHSFLKEKTSGYGEFIADLLRYDTDELIERSGVNKGLIEDAVDLLARHQKIIVCWAMGLTQHTNAVDNIREIVNLLLLKGSIGKPGAGTCPVRGHSNVQGDRTMGIYEKPSASFLDSLKKVFCFEPPRQFGYDTVETIQAMADGKVKVFVSMGGNFVSATPDTDFTLRALKNCDLIVHVSTKLNRGHLVRGKTSIILPCLGRTETDVQKSGEQFVTVENSAGVVHQSRGNKVPVSDKLLSEPAIVAGIAKATLNDVDWSDLIHDYDKIRDLIEKTIPGFSDYNDRVRKPGGFYLPNAARVADFKTSTGKANFSINSLSEHELGAGEFLMMTIRSHDQYNTTIYGLHDRYRGIENGRRVVFVNRDDLRENNLSLGDHVDIESNYDGIARRAEDFVIVPYTIPSRNIATYFPEANNVVPYNRFARKSQTPISKSVIVKLIKR
jgi:molybdopterin-dependent oxidoreductase alpha subunit